MSPVVGPVRQSVRLSCPVQCVVYREALYWRLGLPSRRESGQRLVISTPLLVAPAARQRERRWAGREILSLSCEMPACLPACLLACLPVYLADLTIMNGHGAHRRQGGSQLAAEPACSRRVRPRRNRGGAAVRGRSGKLRQGGLRGRGVHRIYSVTSECPFGMYARADKRETVSREGNGITFL